MTDVTLRRARSGEAKGIARMRGKPPLAEAGTP
jgi:hypothetical protein